MCALACSRNIHNFLQLVTVCSDSNLNMFKAIRVTDPCFFMPGPSAGVHPQGVTGHVQPLVASVEIPLALVAATHHRPP